MRSNQSYETPVSDGVRLAIPLESLPALGGEPLTDHD
jgi:hypothetical protein